MTTDHGAVFMHWYITSAWINAWKTTFWAICENAFIKDLNRWIGISIFVENPMENIITPWWAWSTKVENICKMNIRKIPPWNLFLLHDCYFLLWAGLEDSCWDQILACTQSWEGEASEKSTFPFYQWGAHWSHCGQSWWTSSLDGTFLWLCLSWQCDTCSTNMMRIKVCQY